MLGFPIVDVIAALFIFLCFLPSIHKLRDIYQTPQSKFLLLFVMVILISNLVNGHYDALVDETVLFAKIAIFYFFVVLALSSTDKVRRVMLFIIIMMIFISYQGILQIDTGVNWAGGGLDEQGRMNWVGNFDGANITSVVFILTVPFLLEFIFTKWGWPYKIIAVVAGYFAIIGIYLTNSRAGFLGLVVVIAAFLFQRSKRKKLSVIIIVFITIALMAVAPSRMREIDDKDKSTRGRIEMWAEALDMLKYYPVVGIGKGRFEYYTKSLVAHNAFLQNLGETGLVGSFFWVGMIYSSIVGFRKVLKKESLEPRKISLYRGLFNSFLGLLFCLFFISADFELIYIWTAIITAVILIEDTVIKLERKDYMLISTYIVAFVAFIYIVINLFKAIYIY